MYILPLNGQFPQLSNTLFLLHHKNVTKDEVGRLQSGLPGITGPPTHLLRLRLSHTDRHFVSTASCVKMTPALPSKKLGCHEIETNISSAYEN